MVLFQKLHLLGLLLGFVLLVDREDMIRDAEFLVDPSQIWVVADDERNLYIQISVVISGKDVEQTVGHLRDEDRHLWFHIREIELEIHFVFAGEKGMEILFDFISWNDEIGKVELDTGEECVLHIVHVLVQIYDVSFVDINEVGYRRQDTLLVGAVNQKDCSLFIFHFFLKILHCKIRHFVWFDQ